MFPEAGQQTLTKLTFSTYFEKEVFCDLFGDSEFAYYICIKIISKQYHMKLQDKTQEMLYRGMILNGFAMLAAVILLIPAIVVAVA